MKRRNFLKGIMGVAAGLVGGKVVASNSRVSADEVINDIYDISPTENPYFDSLQVKEVSEFSGWESEELTPIDVNSGVPKGTVIIYSGLIADIPYGWRLADGTNGTVNLKEHYPSKKYNHTLGNITNITPPYHYIIKV